MKTKIILSTTLLVMLAACSSNDNVKPDNDNKGKDRYHAKHRVQGKR